MASKEIISKAFPYTSEYVGMTADGKTPIYDRAIGSSVYRDIWNTYFTQGVGNIDTHFTVTPDGGLNIKVSSGDCFIDGVTVISNDTKYFALDKGESTVDRVDRVVIQNNYTDRYTYIYVKKGNTSTGAVSPLTRNAEIYEIGIADIKVRKNAVEVLKSDITDLRSDTTLCGKKRNKGEYDWETPVSSLQKQALTTERHMWEIMPAAYNTKGVYGGSIKVGDKVYFTSMGANSRINFLNLPTWTWEATSNNTKSVIGPGVHLNGKLYFGSSASPWNIVIYDIASDIWSTGATYNVGNNGYTSLLFAYNNQIYSFGTTTSYQIYNPSSNEWGTAQTLPNSLSLTGTVRGVQASDSVIMFSGGNPQNYTVLSKISPVTTTDYDTYNTAGFLDLSKNSWSSRLLMAARADHTMVASNGKIYIIGGFYRATNIGSNGTYTNYATQFIVHDTVETFTIGDTSYSIAPRLNYPRIRCTAFEHEGYIYVMGGYNAILPAGSMANSAYPFGSVAYTTERLKIN